MALVTIGIPVYNEGAYLAETINSAVCQSLSDIEVIISDNASMDNSVEIAKRYSENDPRVRLIQQSKNIGAHNNFEFLVNQASTPYFVWLGGHDVFETDYLEKAVGYLESNPEVIMVYPENAIFVDQNNQQISGDACSRISSKNIKSGIKRAQNVVENIWKCTNIHGIFRTEILRKLPFEHVIGPDNLMLALAAAYGEIGAIGIVGIKRKELRPTENYADKHKRWKEMGVFSVIDDDNPYETLVDLHLSHIKNINKMTFLDRVWNIIFLRKALYKRYLKDRDKSGKIIT